MPDIEDFRSELSRQLAIVSELSANAVEINSGKLHRAVGGYPGQNHRMPICCQAMESEMRGDDRIVETPPKGRGASLTIRYTLPR